MESQDETKYAENIRKVDFSAVIYQRKDCLKQGKLNCM